MSTIAAISTPHATGGVAMIRISGTEALEIANKVFKPYNKCNILEMKGYTACYGAIYNAEEKLDDGILLVYTAPHSYTGENVAEITCHGGILVSQKVLQCCVNNGATLALAGEFTKRALLNGKLSLTQAEAVIDVINAQNEQCLSLSNAQKQGKLYTKIELLSKDILSISANISAWLDYPDEMEDELNVDLIAEKLEMCRTSLQKLVLEYNTVKLIKDGIPTAIVGKPNVGKSTLMNLLSGEDTSIVTDIAGTTRDIIEETITINGLTLRISDCAGIRETDNMVEQIGVKKMLNKIASSDLIFAIFDSSRPLSTEDQELIKNIRNKNTLCIINKCDLTCAANIDYLKTIFPHVIYVTARDGDAIEAISTALEESFDFSKLDVNAGLLTNERQCNCAKKAYSLLSTLIDDIKSGVTMDIIGISLENILNSLYQLSGKNASEEVINEIFATFCVGK